MVVNLWAPRTEPPTLFPTWKVVLNHAMSSGTNRSHKIRRHYRRNTRAHTRARTLKGIYIISLIIFKRKVKERNDEWFKLMTNLIHECIGVVAHLIRIWKNEFHCTQGLLPTSVNAFHCLHQPNPGEGRCVDWMYGGPLLRVLNNWNSTISLRHVLLMTKIIMKNFV